jgi:hypothetical protein
MSRRIAVVGPEATGKTSLSEGLARALGLPLLADPRPALLASTGCHTLFEAARFRPIWRELLEGQLGREASAGDAVIDTGALDCWVLWQRWGWAGAPPATTERLRAAAFDLARGYSHVIVMPARQLSEFRGHRFLDTDYATQMGRLTQAALAEAGLAGRALALDPGDANAYLRAATAFVAA